MISKYIKRHSNTLAARLRQIKAKWDITCNSLAGKY